MIQDPYNNPKKEFHCLPEPHPTTETKGRASGSNPLLILINYISTSHKVHKLTN
ncbi:hypothetical protein B7P43_G10436 [Cryptotermes secundus]|uniref:Uncharacterized protein n=1 Tax=Cryptotermes secundus TaxID=105785 RepID=A0A2J7PHL0_9NEOP|nr:hypothetical protein B7P43_G10436 [Cryptotermes secundus]